MTESDTAATEGRKQILPEVQVYLTAREDADVTLNTAARVISEKYPGRYGYAESASKQRRAYEHEVQEADTAHRIAINQGWNGLKQSSNPLARWISENCKDYQSEALEVLKVLPATLDELDDLAAERDWCSIWGQFRDEAIEAGAIEGLPPVTPAHQAVVDWADRQIGLRRRTRAELDRLLHALSGEAAQGAIAQAAA